MCILWEKKDEIRSASKGLTQAEIAVKTAQMKLEKTRIKAPFAGIITDIQVSPQEHIANGRDLFILVNISRIQVHATVLESEIGKMRKGREVTLRFSAYPDKIFHGKVKSISPVVNPEDKTCKVIIDVANPEEEIKPGMHAEVEIAAEIYKDKLLVPQDAVLDRGDENWPLWFKMVWQSGDMFRLAWKTMSLQRFYRATGKGRASEMAKLSSWMAISHWPTMLRLRLKNRLGIVWGQDT